MTDGQQNIDCLEALDRLYEYLDEELTPVRAEEVRQHLEKCAPCLAVSQFESAYLKFLEARAKAREAPEALRKRLLERLLFEPDEPAGP
jgi:anti-sigma factor (TIGR02949 family)